MSESSKRTCPECGETFGNAWQAVSFARHRWEAHGIAGEATFNGKLMRFGPSEQKLTFWQRYTKAQFVDNNPRLNAFINVFVVFPLTLGASVVTAIVVFWPLTLLPESMTPSSTTDEICHPTPFGCE